MTVIDTKFIKAFKLDLPEEYELTQNQVISLAYLLNRHIKEIDYIQVRGKNLIGLKYDVLELCIDYRHYLQFYKKVRELFKRKK